jgi:hypothetical protein
VAFKLKTGTVASAARTTTGQSAAIPIAELGGQLSVFVDVTAISGTPNMVISVEWSHDGVTFFKGDPADQMTAITAVGSAVKVFTVKAPQYRIVWTISGGTPSLTFQTHEYVTSL